jgi:hypothetical protein
MPCRAESDLSAGHHQLIDLAAEQGEGLLPSEAHCLPWTLVRTHYLLFGASKQKRQGGIVLCLLLTESTWTYISAVMSCAFFGKYSRRGDESKMCVSKPNADVASPLFQVVLLNTTLLFEFWINVHFGSAYCQEINLLKFIHWVESFSGIPKQKTIASLNTCCGWAWVMILVCVASYVATYPTKGTAGLAKEGVGFYWLVAIDVFFFYVATAPLLYLCMLWLWINQTFYQITKSHMESLALETLHMNRADRWLHELLGKMESVSSQWTWNHNSTLLCLVGKRICLCVCVE